MADPAIRDAPPLAVDGVGHAFGRRQALDGVSFAVGRGSFTVLLGPNGAGKTTLFSLVTRLYDTRSGSIRVLGHDVRRAPTRALGRMGVVFQQRTLDLDLSVAQNLAYHAALHGIAAGDARSRITGALDLIGLADRRDDKVRRLSGGQIRRVEIARCLLHEPDLLLLDEPTVGLDIDSRREILDRVRALCRDRGLGALWATHLIDETAQADQVIVLHRGRIRAAGPVGRILEETGSADLGAAYAALTRDEAA